MPRDLDGFHPAFPSMASTLLRNPYREKKETKKKTKATKGARAAAAGKLEGATQGGKLQQNEKFEYKPSEFGNYPMRNDGKPRSGAFRLMLPADADWTGKRAAVDA